MTEPRPCKFDKYGRCGTSGCTGAYTETRLCATSSPVANNKPAPTIHNPASEQPVSSEPVAWQLWENEQWGRQTRHRENMEDWLEQGCKFRPLYTHPDRTSEALLAALKYARRFVKEGYADTDYIDEAIKHAEAGK